MRRTRVRCEWILTLIVVGTVTLVSQQRSESSVYSVEVKWPNIIVKGTHLQRVEVWAVPSGTGITPDEFTLLGNAKRISTSGRHEVWLFPFVCSDTRLTATEIFVKGFDAHGRMVGKKSLPYVGVSEVHDALCGT
jgi:hypothetical protein